MPSAFDTAHASDAVICHLVHAVVDTRATIEDYQKLAQIVQEAQENNLPPEQIEAKIREITPFASIPQYLKDNHLPILSIILTIVLYVLSQQRPTKVEIVTPSIEDIIRRLETRHVDENRPAPPTPTEVPNHKDAPGTRCS